MSQSVLVDQILLWDLLGITISVYMEMFEIYIVKIVRFQKGPLWNDRLLDQFPHKIHRTMSYDMTHIF